MTFRIMGRNKSRCNLGSLWYKKNTIFVKNVLSNGGGGILIYVSGLVSC